MSFIFRPGGGGGGTPGGSNGQVQVNVAGAFGAYSTFTYASNILGVESITGTALTMTIQPKIPTVLETGGSLLLKTPNAVKSNTRGGDISLFAGDGLNFGDGGTVNLRGGIGFAGGGVTLTGANGTASAGGIFLVGGQVVGSPGTISVSGSNGVGDGGAIELYGGGRSGGVHGSVLIGSGGVVSIKAQLNNAGSMTMGFFNTALTTQPTIAAVATDPATTQTLANSLRTAIINLGLGA